MEQFIDNRAFERLDKTLIEIQLIRSEILKETVSFFHQRDFSLIDPPIIHEYIPNKKSEIYLSISDKEYALNSSNALYLSAYAAIFGKVFAISPTFRDEKIPKSHLSEFKMLEVELLNCSFDECVELVSDYIKSILYRLCNMHIRTVFARRISGLYSNLQIDFQSYSDIIKKLQATDPKIQQGLDLSDYDDKVSSVITNPTFVTDYPFPLASWTALPKIGKTAYAFNLILPDQYGELAEGCQRNTDYKVFEYKFEKAGIRSLDWYMNAIKDCSIERSGFGLGIDRLIRWIVGCENIADTVFFPRFNEMR